MSGVNVASVVASSSLSEVCWLADGKPHVRGVVTLLRGAVPVLAFTYADADVAHALVSSPVVALALTETRSTGAAFTPLLLRGRCTLTEDVSGDLFTAELLEQELRRFPPARVLADSPLLRREHWWYLPRLLVSLHDAEVEPLAGRAAPRDHLLVVGDGGRIDVQPGGVTERTDASLSLDLARDTTTGPAVVFGQDASFPDLERWTQWRYTGHWDGRRLTVAEAPSRTGLGPTPGLWQRWRRQRELERRCRSAIPST